MSRTQEPDDACKIDNNVPRSDFWLRDYLEPEITLRIEPAIQKANKLVFMSERKHEEPNALKTLDSLLTNNGVYHHPVQRTFLEDTSLDNVNQLTFGDHFYGCLGHSEMNAIISQGKDRYLTPKSPFLIQLHVKANGEIGILGKLNDRANIDLLGAVRSYRQFMDIYDTGLIDLVSGIDIGEKTGISLDTKQGEIQLAYASDEYVPGTERAMECLLNKNGVAYCTPEPSLMDTKDDVIQGLICHSALGLTRQTTMIRRSDITSPGDGSLLVALKIGSLGRYDPNKEMNNIFGAAQAFKEFADLSRSGNLPDYIAQHSLR